MTALDALLLRLALASLGCLAAGGSVWALGALLRRWLPALAAQRSLWLLGQMTVAITFVLMLLPHSERVRLVPPIEYAAQAVTQYLPARQPSAPVTPAAPQRPAANADDHDWPAYGARAWGVLYLAGLAWALLRLARARHALDRLAATGRAAAPVAGASVVEVDAPISPMLLGLFKPRLLLPRHLQDFDETQRRMIMEHELTHLRRHDLHWMAAGFLLQTLLWFNPFMHLLRSSLTWAQELGCDRDVLRGRPQSQRKAYAAALVTQLRLQCGAMPSALAFGGFSIHTLAERVAAIRTPRSAAQGRLARCAAIVGLAAVAAANFALQPALAWNTEPLPPAWAALACTTLVDAASGLAIEHTGQCGVRVTPVSTFNIAVSLMGYDSGLLKHEHAPLLPFKEGYIDWQPSWRQALDPAGWIRTSSVWYAQQVTTSLGAARFQRYVQAFGYGNRDVSGDQGAGNGLRMAWIDSSLKISADEQAAFLRRLVNRDLGVSAQAYDMTARVLRLDVQPDGWEIHGKTGSGYPLNADGKEDRQHAYGWFVGWASKHGRTIVFAHLTQDQRDETTSAGPRARDAFLRTLPARLAAAP